MSSEIIDEVLFHVGYHKTATTLLQKTLFSEEIGYFISDRSKRNCIIDAFVSPSCLAGANVAKLKDLFSETKICDARQMKVVSHERLAGYPATGGVDQEIIARRIKENFPNARILMVIREQNDIILSMYYQYIVDGGALSLRDYLSGTDRMLHRYPQFSFEYYDYIEAFKMYQNLFGASNVLCLPYEMLISEPERFLNSILEFCDFTSAATGFGDRIASNRINSRKSILELCMRRLANKIFRTQLSNYGFKAITRRQLNAGFKRLSPYFPVVKAIENRQDLKARSVIRRTIMNRYRRSNSDLSQMLGMDLGYYGYDTESSAN